MLTTMRSLFARRRAPAPTASSGAYRAWLKLPRLQRRATWLAARRAQARARKAGASRHEAKRMFPWDIMLRVAQEKAAAARARASIRRRLAGFILRRAARLAGWIAR